MDTTYIKARTVYPLFLVLKKTLFSYEDIFFAISKETLILLLAATTRPLTMATLLPEYFWKIFLGIFVFITNLL